MKENELEFYNNYYLKTREDSAIIDAFSDGPHNNRSTDGYINFGKGGYQLRLTINGVETEENPPIYTEDGIPLYKWDGSKVIRRSDEEIEADRAGISVPSPSAQEQLRADVDFIAAMTGVIL